VLLKEIAACAIVLAVSAAAWVPTASAQSPLSRQPSAAKTKAAGIKAAKKLHEQAQQAERAGEWQNAFELLSDASALAPANTDYVFEREAVRFRLVQQHMDSAEREALAGRMEQARELVHQALRLDRTYTVAQERLQQFSSRAPQVAEVRAAPDEELIRVEPQPGKKTISFRGQVGNAYEELGRQFGITASVDLDVRGRSVQFSFREVDFWTAIGLLAKLTATGWRAIDRHAILVFDDTQINRRQYVPNVERSVVLPGSTTPERMTETSRLVREIAGVTHTFLDSRSRTLTLRDSPENVNLAVELINQLEQKRGEVMLEINILEVDRATAQKLGISPPTTGRVVTVSPQDIAEAQQSTQALLQVVQRLFGSVSTAGITGQVRPEALIPPLIAFGGGKTVFLSTLPGAAADFAESLSLIRQGRRVLLRGEDGEPATFFVGERYPINLSVLAPGLVGNPVAPGVTTQNFERVDIDVGESPVAVVAGDFNGDAKLDLAVANQTTNKVSVLLGNNDGSFGTRTEFDTGNGPISLVTGDFNGDGVLDLVVVNQDDNSISILLGQGDGTFAPRIDTAVGAGPNAIVAGDFNSDTRVDLAVTNQEDNTVSILLGNGDGIFSTASVLAAGSAPRGIAIGDLNGDGLLDLAIVNDSANTLSIWLGRAGGTFGLRTDFATGERPSAVAIADLDGDSRQEVIVGNQSDNTVSVYLGNGDGTFAKRTDFNTGAGPVAVAVRDVTGDGELDLVIANESGDSLSVLVGSGDGGFSARGDFAVGDAPTSVATGDFDNDGRVDAVASNRNSNSVTAILNHVTIVPTGERSISPYPGFQYEDLGLKVRATPRLHADNEVTLQLEIELRARSGNSFNGIPVISNTTVEQTVRLKENETTLISGILQTERQRGTSGWPGLGQLPLTGRVASSRSRNDQERELLILITPRRINLAERKSRLLFAGREPAGSAGGAAVPRQPPE